MTSAAPWGAIPQSEGVATAVAQAIEDLDEKLPQNIQDRLPPTQKSDLTPDSESLSDLDKGASNPEVINLAQQLTQHSIKNAEGDYHNPFFESDDPALNPSSGHFNPEAWVRTLIGLQSRDPERYPQRVAGISYKTLNVYGFGSLADYQK